ncbi:MAG TPA: hypothetical protein VK856_13605 [Anaerolineaceae bacterium]|nr:hypothetical protein [Anaerolineaceae bacterium]
MAKLSNYKKIAILLFLLVFILACNMPIADIVENPLNEPTTEEEDQEIQQINTEIDRNFEGTQTYHIKPLPGANNSTECKPGYEFGDRWTSNTISRFNDEENWDRSQIEIEAVKNNVFIYHIVIKEKPNTFCRLNEQNLVECVYLDTDGYTVRVFNDPPYNKSFQPYVLDEPKTCYTMVFEEIANDQVPGADKYTTISFSIPPDTMEITLWGPIPAMPVTSNKTGQTYEKGHETLWDFQPKSSENWYFNFLIEKKVEKISGSFIGRTFYHEEDPLYFIDGEAEIRGIIPHSKYTIEQEGELRTIYTPFRMTFSGKVHEPNQFSASGSEINYLVYHDVDFNITVVGSMKIVLSNDETVRVELDVNDCVDSKFSSTNEGAQLTKCYVLLIWDNVPLE